MAKGVHFCTVCDQLQENVLTHWKRCIPLKNERLVPRPQAKKDNAKPTKGTKFPKKKISNRLGPPPMPKDQNQQQQISITAQTKKNIRDQLGLNFEKEIDLFTPVDVPKEILDTTGDGNCLFRSLALAVTGSQDQHKNLRLAVVQHMLTNDFKSTFVPVYGFVKTVEEYLEDERMANDGTFGTSTEIFAASQLMGIDVVTFTKYGPQPHIPSINQRGPNAPKNDCIYLYYTSQHYQLITS